MSASGEMDKFQPLNDGQRDFVEKLYTRYAETVRRLARRNLGSQDAEDVVITVFLKAAIHVVQRDHPTNPQDMARWIFSVTRTSCIDIIRANSVRSSVPIEDGFAVSADAMEDKIHWDMLLVGCMETLDPLDQCCMEMRADGYTYNQIIDELGLTETYQQVRTRVLKAYARMRCCLESKGYHVDPPSSE